MPCNICNATRNSLNYPVSIFRISLLVSVRTNNRYWLQDFGLPFNNLWVTYLFYQSYLAREEQRQIRKSCSPIQNDNFYLKYGLNYLNINLYVKYYYIFSLIYHNLVLKVDTSLGKKKTFKF